MKRIYTDWVRPILKANSRSKKTDIVNKKIRQTTSLGNKPAKFDSMDMYISRINPMDDEAIEQIIDSGHSGFKVIRYIREKLVDRFREYANSGFKNYSHNIHLSVTEMARSIKMARSATANYFNIIFVNSGILIFEDDDTVSLSFHYSPFQGMTNIIKFHELEAVSYAALHPEMNYNERMEWLYDRVLTKQELLILGDNSIGFDPERFMIEPFVLWYMYNNSQHTNNTVFTLSVNDMINTAIEVTGMELDRQEMKGKIVNCLKEMMKNGHISMTKNKNIMETCEYQYSDSVTFIY